MYSFHSVKAYTLRGSKNHAICLGIAASQDPDRKELTRDVAPERVLDTLEAMQQQTAAKAQTDEP